MDGYGDGGAWPEVEGIQVTEPVLLVAKEEGIATLRLNRPQQMNALSPELRQALHKSVARVSAA